MHNFLKKNITKQVYITVFINNLKKNGITWLIQRIFIRIMREFLWIIFLPLIIFLHLLGFRHIPIKVEHIGHLATEFDTFLKAQQLHIIPKKRYFVLAPKHKISNAHLLNYWHHYFSIISNFHACTFLEILTRRYFLKTNISLHSVNFFGTQDIYKINELWDHRPATLQLTKEDEEWGYDMLTKLGIPQNTWFVCLHVREGGFLPHNELIQSHRNASVANTIPAIHEVIRRGGIVVRLGDSSMTPLEKINGVIDYANHPLKSERMDIILCAKARFFLGCTSGLAFVSMIFGVPVAHANMIPMETLGIRECDLSMPKLLWSQSLNRYLTFPEVMTSDIGGFFFTQQYREAGINYEENTSEDILNLTVEMLDRLDGTFISNLADEALHSKYMSLLKPGHYSYGAISRIPIAFLKKYQHLLDNAH